MPQIVHADAAESRQLADRAPWAFDLNEAPTTLPGAPRAALRRKEERARFPIRLGCPLIGGRLHLGQEKSHWCRQRNPVLAFLLSVARRLYPEPGLKVELIPISAEHFTPAGTGQQQQPDRVGRDLIGVSGQGLGESPQLIAGEVSCALLLVVPLEPPRRVVGPHLPADGKVEHLGQQRRGAIRARRRPMSGDLAVHPLDVGVAQVSDLSAPEFGPNPLRDQALILTPAALTLARRVLEQIPLGQVAHRRRGTLLVALAHRIAALVDEPLEALRFLACRRYPPVRV